MAEVNLARLATARLLELRHRIQRRLDLITLELMRRGDSTHMLIHELRADRERRELIPR